MISSSHIQVCRDWDADDKLGSNSAANCFLFEESYEPAEHDFSSIIRMWTDNLFGKQTNTKVIVLLLAALFVLLRFVWMQKKLFESARFLGNMGAWAQSMDRGSKLQKLWAKLYSRAHDDSGPDQRAEFRKEFSDEAAGSDFESIHALGKFVSDVPFSRARLELAQRIGTKLRELEASGDLKSFEMLLRVSAANMTQADHFMQVLTGSYGKRGNCPKSS